MKRLINFFFFMIFVVLFFPKLNAQQQALFLDTEQTISMDFKDAQLKDILKIFSIQSGMNFIASEAVQDRTITLYLDSVPIQEAMDKLFKANNLSYDLDKRANIFIVKDWGRPDVETVCRIFYLKYATVSVSSLKEETAQQLQKSLPFGSSTELAPTASEAEGGKWKKEEIAGITEVVKKLLSEHGSVIEDFRTNSLIVRDIPSRMPTISQAIAALDVPVPQVMLEVEILDVSKNAVDKLGIKFPQSLVKLDMSAAGRETRFPFGNKGTEPSGTMGLGNTTAGGWSISDWNANKFGPSVFSILNTQLAFDFLRTQSDTKYLARPRILTLNNELAEIKIATKEAIGLGTQTESVEGKTSITEGAERVETGVSLRVIPQINQDTGEITMYICPSVAEARTGGTFGTQTFKDPEVRSTKCVVRVKDAETIVIGGLIRTEFSQTKTKVPFLGDIPFLGGMFRHRDKDKGIERELLVFITPHIMKESVAGLVSINKSRLPEREQETASSINRQEAISSSLNTFDKNSY